MAVSTRHVRWDWQNFIDDPGQNTVKSLCNVKTRTHLAGVPGVTKQPISVPTNNPRVSKFGWCAHCMRLLSSQVIGWYRKPIRSTSPLLAEAYGNLCRVIVKHSEIANENRNQYIHINASAMPTINEIEEHIGADIDW